MTWLDLGMILLFGGYSALCWPILGSTWRGEVPEAGQVRAATGMRGARLRLRYMFGWQRTCVVQLLSSTAILLAYLGVRLHDFVATPAVYLIAGVLSLVAVVSLVLWGMVAGLRWPRFVVPPHLRDYEEE